MFVHQAMCEGVLCAHAAFEGSVVVDVKVKWIVCRFR